MNQGQRGHHARILQVLVVGPDLPGQQHAFVDDGTRGHRRHIKLLAVLEPERLDCVARHLADDVQLALQSIGHRHPGAAADEYLADYGFDDFDRFAEVAIVAGNVAPAQQDLAFVLDGALDLVFAGQPGCRLLGEEHHAHAVLAGRGQLHSLPGHFLPEELVRDLDQDAGAVAGQRVGPDRTAVGQVFEDQQALIDNGVAFHPFDVRNESHAACVVFIGRIVESLPRR